MSTSPSSHVKVVHEAEVDDVHGYLRVVDVFQRLQDLVARQRLSLSHVQVSQSLSRCLAVPSDSF